MSLLVPNKLDDHGVSLDDKNLILTIIDDLDWEDGRDHLLKLQTKINYYLGAIESGQLYEAYPQYQGLNIEFLILSQYIVPTEGIEFLRKVANLFTEAGYGLRCNEWIPGDEKQSPDDPSWKTILDSKKTEEPIERGSIDNLNVVDSIHTDNETGHVILAIYDHLDWEDEANHLEILRDKLNLYLATVESGELVEIYPEAQGRTIEFRIYAQHPYPPVAMDYLATASEYVSRAGFVLNYLDKW